MKKLAIIPAYNEMGNIEKTVNDIRENAKSFDYIVIDDCSTDDTAKICEEQGFSFISLPTNLGIGGSVQTGYLYAVKHGTFFLLGRFRQRIRIDKDEIRKGFCIHNICDFLFQLMLDLLCL